MKKGINCVYCVNYLESLVIKQGCQLIDIKNRGGLVIPAKNVVTIVKLADGTLESFVKKRKILCQKDIIKKIEVGVKTLVLENHPIIFSNLNDHLDDLSCTSNHRLNLIDKIVACYVSLRLKHYCRCRKYFI